MRAMVWTRAGSPDGLQLKEVEKPAARDNEILVRIRATTVTIADCKLRGSVAPIAFKLLGVMRSGPIILGQELAGEIEAVGKQVTRYTKGDQICGWCGLRLGAYAEYACLPANGVITVKPSNMTFEEAVPLSVGGLEAVYFMKKAEIQSGQKVLINGAGGTIGTFAVQLARYFGAEVTSVDSTEKLDMLRSIGADHVIDYTKADFTKSGEIYDVIFDVVGKSSASRSVNVLTTNGRYLLGNPGLSQTARARWMTGRSGKKVIAWAQRTKGEYAEDFAFLKQLIEAGKITSVIDKCYPLEQIAEAHRYVEAGHKKGNVVITVA